jgi:hypothetical protein
MQSTEKFFVMIAKPYVLAGEYCLLYRSQISYRDGFVFEEEDLSHPGTRIAVQYDIPNNPDHRLGPHKSRVYLKSIRNHNLDQIF